MMQKELYFRVSLFLNLADDVVLESISKYGTLSKEGTVIGSYKDSTKIFHFTTTNLEAALEFLGKTSSIDRLLFITKLYDKLMELRKKT